MKFVDLVHIKVKAGKGGAGAVSFRREKYAMWGGPNGGDGGAGADVVLRATHNMGTLLDFKYLDHYEAANGGNGASRDMTGRSGERLVIPVPVGTLVMDDDTGEVLADLAADGQEAVVAKGGRGGKGNAHFKSSTHRTPRFSQPGEPAEEKKLRLELKLLADVGLVGLPNVGKSTLLSVISSARPKVADYPFTTLVPFLGVVKPEHGKSFVVADIPGLIKGAHEGAGLGIQFLRHVERTRVLLHLVDVSEILEDDPVDQFETVRHELVSYHPDLVRKRLIVGGTKTDIKGEGARLARLSDHCAERGYPFFPICAPTGEGIARLLRALSHEVFPQDEEEVFVGEE